jgi:hypothetical protein
VTVRHDASPAPGTIELIRGSSFRGLATHPAASPVNRKRAPARADGQHARVSYGGTIGTASCKSDTAAFAGPNSLAASAVRDCVGCPPGVPTAWPRPGPGLAAPLAPGLAGQQLARSRRLVSFAVVNKQIAPCQRQLVLEMRGDCRK